MNNMKIIQRIAKIIICGMAIISCMTVLVLVFVAIEEYESELPCIIIGKNAGAENTQSGQFIIKPEGLPEIQTTMTAREYHIIKPVIDRMIK